MVGRRSGPDREAVDVPACRGGSAARRRVLRVPDGIGRRSRFLRFVLVGLVNTAFGYGAFALLYFATDSHRIGIMLATAVGILFNFMTTGRLVFASRSLRAFGPFVLGYAIVGALNIALVDGLAAVGAGPLVGQFLALPVVVLASFVINDRAVFGAGP